jgi:hypothetical protein
MCPAVVVTISISLNCVVTFILECPVYVHLKSPYLPTTTTLPVSVMRDFGIKYPFSLDIDMRGQLWVGCVEGSEGSNAKIHIVKLLL